MSMRDYAVDDYGLVLDEETIKAIGVKVLVDYTEFKKAYDNMDEIIVEMREKLGEYLAEDYDYRSKICHICGTYFG